MATTKIGTPELFDFSATNTALQLPTGTTAERPGTLAGTAAPVAGEWRYNTTLSYVEFYDGAAWFQIDTEAAANADAFPSENFNVSTYFGNGATQEVDAKFNEAANFGGGAGRIDLPQTILGSGSTKIFSISQWFRTSSTAEQYLNNSAAAGAFTGFGIFINPTTGYLRYQTSNGSGSSPYLSLEDRSVQDGNWHNVVATYSSAGGTNDAYMYLHLDGQNVTALCTPRNGWTQGGGATWSSFTIPRISLGNWADSSTYPNGLYPLIGRMDQVRFFNTALTDAQAEDLWTDETTTTAATLNFPTGAGCIAAYQLDGNAEDISGNYNGAVGMIYDASNDVASQSVGYTGLKFSPDMVWIKPVNAADNHNIYDSVRGVQMQLVPNGTQQSTSQVNTLTAFNTNGWTTGNDNNTNTNAIQYVAWNFKAGGAPSAVNIAGVGVAPTPDSVMIDGVSSTTALTGSIAVKNISANTKAGFSVVSHAGTGVAGTVDHGLQKSPDLIIYKQTSSTAVAKNWVVYSSPLGETKTMGLNLSSNGATDPDAWNDTPPTTTVFSLGIGDDNYGSQTNVNGSENIVYCFANIDGYQRIDNYLGNGSEYGPIIYTTNDGTATGTDGFEPAFVMIKSTDYSSSTNWTIFDNKRSTSNRRTNYLYADDIAIQANAPSLNVNFYSNGFQVLGVDGTHNANGFNYIYLAIAKNSDTSTPTVANSFGLTLNTSPANNQPVATTFKPDSLWAKAYDATGSGNPTGWGQYDKIRGNGMSLQSDNTGVESNYANHPTLGNLGMVFSDNGYINPPNVNNNLNNTLDDYVSYFWKLGGTQTINNDGTSTSVVTANAASGCSVAILNQPDTTARNFGHGLGGIPEMMIIKSLVTVDSWYVYHKDLGNDTRISLDTSDAKVSPTGVWDTTTPDDTVFYLQNQTGGYHVNYLFRSIPNYQQVGSYEGNQATGVDNQIDFGFAPRFVLIKNADSNSSQWMVFDSVRTNGYALYANQTTDEDDYSADLTLSSQGLRFESTNINVNQSGATYIYLAIA